MSIIGWSLLRSLQTGDNIDLQTCHALQLQGTFTIHSQSDIGYIHKICFGPSMSSAWFSNLSWLLCWNRKDMRQHTLSGITAWRHTARTHLIKFLQSQVACKRINLHDNWYGQSCHAHGLFLKQVGLPKHQAVERKAGVTKGEAAYVT